MTSVETYPLTGAGGIPAAASGHPATATAVTAAVTAAPAVAEATPAQRAQWMRAVADALSDRVNDLAEVAEPETHLGIARLSGEVERTTNQWRFYADVAKDGGWLEATIDHATETAPDLRRMRVPLGPVAVFGASNFPFAFGALGNDTASAIAAGCPVVVKEHPAHPLTHALLLDIATTALAAAGAPAGILGTVSGFEAGTELVLHPAIHAVAFTGSQRGGMALHALTWNRTVPIPVYAEMGTVNPVVVTSSGAEHAATVGAGAVASFTLGMGQFCTKPGLLLVPAGSTVLDEVTDALTRHTPRGQLLTPGIATAYVAGIDRLVAAGGTVVAYVPEPGPGNSVSAVVMTAPASALVPGSALLEECFGPVLLVVEYADAAERDAVLATLQGALVAAVMTGSSDDPELPDLLARLTPLVGRIAVDAWPTGVATTWAQHHGGPWPSTSVPSATSVGARALDRFTRPITLQGVPAAALPTPLLDANVWRIPRRVDGRARAARATT